MAEKTILILNGPGLSESGSPHDRLTLAQIERQCMAHGANIGLGIDFRQYDDMAKLARCITHELENHAGLIINPVSYSQAAHINPALIEQALDITADLHKPVIEVHVHNTFLPDSGIKHPLQSPASNIAFIAGLGTHSYLLAMQAIQQRISKSNAGDKEAQQ